MTVQTASGQESTANQFLVRYASHQLIGYVLLYGYVGQGYGHVLSTGNAFDFISLQTSNFLTCNNLMIIMLWIFMGILVFYIKNMSREVINDQVSVMLI